MTQQRKLGTYAPSALWPDGTSARPLPSHVVAQGDVERAAEAKTLPPVTAELLARGQQRFGIFCAPCHGLAGDGDGIIVAHGFPAPPSYYIDRLEAAPAQHFYDVMTNGYGVMFAYADRVDPHDRWAIAAYIRALQLSRHASLADVPDAAEHVR
jgi:mono/diheme cytochrome c family protein